MDRYFGCLCISGTEKEAQEAAKETLKIQPEFSLEHYEKTLMHKDKADATGYIEALRKAGLNSEEGPELAEA